MNNVNIQNVNVELTAELGRTKRNIKDILQMGEGTIVELDKNANEPITVYVNNVKFAEGECVAVDECYGIRITKIFSEAERRS